MGVVFGIENYQSASKDVRDLCQTWWKDSPFYLRTGIPYNPNMRLFQLLDETKQLICLTARVNGRLVACYVGTIGPFIFNPGYKFFQELVWCIAKDYRGTDLLPKFLNYIETTLPQKGANLWSLCLPMEDDKAEKIGNFLEKNKYFPADRTYMRCIYG